MNIITTTPVDGLFGRLKQTARASRLSLARTAPMKRPNRGPVKISDAYVARLIKIHGPEKAKAMLVKMMSGKGVNLAKLFGSAIRRTVKPAPTANIATLGAAFGDDYKRRVNDAKSKIQNYEVSIRVATEKVKELEQRQVGFDRGVAGANKQLLDKETERQLLKNKPKPDSRKLRMIESEVEAHKKMLANALKRQKDGAAELELARNKLKSLQQELEKRKNDLVAAAEQEKANEAAEKVNRAEVAKAREDFVAKMKTRVDDGAPLISEHLDPDVMFAKKKLDEARLRKDDELSDMWNREVIFRTEKVRVFNRDVGAARMAKQREIEAEKTRLDNEQRRIAAVEAAKRALAEDEARRAKAKADAEERRQKQIADAKAAAEAHQAQIKRMKELALAEAEARRIKAEADIAERKAKAAQDIAAANLARQQREEAARESARLKAEKDRQAAEAKIAAANALIQAEAKKKADDAEARRVAAELKAAEKAAAEAESRAQAAEQRAAVTQSAEDRSSAATAREQATLSANAFTTATADAVQAVDVARQSDVDSTVLQTVAQKTGEFIAAVVENAPESPAAQAALAGAEQSAAAVTAKTDDMSGDKKSNIGMIVGLAVLAGAAFFLTRKRR